MCVRILLAFAVLPLFAADEAQMAVVLRAQTDFDRVELSARPRLEDTASCAQSQAALLPVALPDQLSIIHFRKGFCALTGALLTRDRQSFDGAAREFDEAVASWASRPKDKRKPAEPVSSALGALAAIARLENNPEPHALPELDQRLADSVSASACPATVMPIRLCQDVLARARQWRGWIAFRQNRIDDAQAEFNAFAESGWASWVAGRQVFAKGRFREAALAYRRAADYWLAREKNSPVTIPAGLEPPGELEVVLTDLGGADLLAGDTQAAINDLDAALKRKPRDSWALFLRARARDAAGQMTEAMADYNLAGRTALAQASGNAEGDAHLYRGVGLFRKGDYAKAEEEFMSALNQELSPGLRPDLLAWRSLAAVRAGGCEASRQGLERNMAAASPFFPREEARLALASCTTAQPTSAAVTSGLR